MQFQLAIVVSSNPISFIIPYIRLPDLKKKVENSSIL